MPNLQVLFLRLSMHWEDASHWMQLGCLVWAGGWPLRYRVVQVAEGCLLPYLLQLQVVQGCLMPYW